MEKMSGILPSSPRVTSVDLKESPPARPGAPSHGRKPGRNTIADRVSLSQKAKEMAAEETLLGKNPKEESRIKSVNEINRKFFETRLKPVEAAPAPVSEAATESLLSVEETAPVNEALSRYEAMLGSEAPQLSTPSLSVEA